MQRLERHPDPDILAGMAAEHITGAIRDAVETRGVCTLAFSGGSSPLGLFAALAKQAQNWRDVHIFQVDERAVASGSEQRNWTALQAVLLDHIDLPPTRLHPMPVEQENLEKAATAYQACLESICGQPPVLDVVHLGLGADGHTASLVPGDTVLDDKLHEVAVSDVYQGHRRMTLTFPCLKRARQLVWFITGSGKQAALSGLLDNDPGIPAGRLHHGRQALFTNH